MAKLEPGLWFSRSKFPPPCPLSPWGPKDLLLKHDTVLGSLPTQPESCCHSWAGRGYLSQLHTLPTALPFSLRRLFCRAGPRTHPKEQPLTVGAQTAHKPMRVRNSLAMVMWPQGKEALCLGHPDTPRTVPVYACGPGIIINSTPFYSLKWLHLNNKLYTCTTYTCLEES